MYKVRKKKYTIWFCFTHFFPVFQRKLNLLYSFLCITVYISTSGTLVAMHLNPVSFSAGRTKAEMLDLWTLCKLRAIISKSALVQGLQKNWTTYSGLIQWGLLIVGSTQKKPTHTFFLLTLDTWIEIIFVRK